MSQCGVAESKRQRRRNKETTNRLREIEQSKQTLPVVPLFPILPDGTLRPSISPTSSTLSGCHVEFYIGEESKSVACQTDSSPDHVDAVASSSAQSTFDFMEYLAQAKVAIAELMTVITETVNIDGGTYNDAMCLQELSEAELEKELEARYQALAEEVHHQEEVGVFAATAVDLRSMDWRDNFLPGVESEVAQRSCWTGRLRCYRTMCEVTRVSPREADELEQFCLDILCPCICDPQLHLVCWSERDSHHWQRSF